MQSVGFRFQSRRRMKNERNAIETMPVLGLPVKQRKGMSCALLSDKSLVRRMRRLSLVRQIAAIQVVGCSGMEQRKQTHMGR